MVEESMVKFLPGLGWLLHNTPFSLQKISQTATPTKLRKVSIFCRLALSLSVSTLRRLHRPTEYKCLQLDR